MTGSWFWWGSNIGAATYKKLFQLTVTTLKAKGVHNLIYCWAPDKTADFSFYPGDAYVDILGMKGLDRECSHSLFCFFFFFFFFFFYYFYFFFFFFFFFFFLLLLLLLLLFFFFFFYYYYSYFYFYLYFFFFFFFFLFFLFFFFFWMIC
jgi:hypothetical protein